MGLGGGKVCDGLDEEESLNETLMDGLRNGF